MKENKLDDAINETFYQNWKIVIT